jgi:hypothetical protein
MERAGQRASDADRRRVVDQLQQHYVDGRLSTDELDDRTHRALAARTFGALDVLVADLPSVSAAPAAPAPEPAPVEARPDGLWDDGSFRAHALSYGLVMALLVAIWLLTSPGGYFWPVWPMLGWGFGLASHALGSSVGRSRARDKHPRAVDRDEE